MSIKKMSEEEWILHQREPVLTQEKKVEKPKKDHFLRGVLYASGIFFFFSLYQLHLDYSRLWTGTWKLFEFAGKMLPPDVTNWKKILYAALESLQIALVGTVLGIYFIIITRFSSGRKYYSSPSDFL